MATIPPWLDVSPSQFLQAREAGVRTGIESAQSAEQGAGEAAQRGQQNRQEGARLDQQRQLERARLAQQAMQASMQAGLEGARIAQSAAQAAQQLGLEKQKLEAAQKQTAMEFQASQETAKQNFLLKQTQDSVNNAINQAKIGLGQQRIDQTAKQVQQAAQIAAAKLAAQTAKTATAAPKADPVAMNRFQTLQSAYLNSVREYHSSVAKGDTNSAAIFKKDAEDYKDKADKIAEKISGTALPAGAFAAATATGTSPGPATSSGQPQKPSFTSDFTKPGLTGVGRETGYSDPATGQQWRMGPAAAAGGEMPVTVPAPGQPALAAAPAAAGSGTKDNPIKPKSKEEAGKLSSGTWIQDPAGNVFQLP